MEKNYFNTYWINLDRSSERKKNMEEFFLKNDINNTRFSAIDRLNGNQIENLVTFKENVFVEEKCRGQIACLLSHLFLIKNFYEKDPNDYCLILEDDIDFQYFNKYNLDFEKTINKVILDCKHDWEIIQLSFTVRKNKEFKLKSNDLYFKWKDSYYGTIAYIINKKGALKLINNNFKDDKILIDLTTDDKKNYYVADCLLYKQVNTYTFKIPIFSFNINFKSIVGSKEDSIIMGARVIKDTIQFYDTILQTYPKNQ